MLALSKSERKQSILGVLALPKSRRKQSYLECLHQGNFRFSLRPLDVASAVADITSVLELELELYGVSLTTRASGRLVGETRLSVLLLRATSS